MIVKASVGLYYPEPEVEDYNPEELEYSRGFHQFRKR